MRRTSPLFALTIAAFSLGGCGYADRAPPESPPKEMPQGVEPRTSPPEPGTTRVVIDANGERATVTDVVDSTSIHGTATAGGTTAYVSGHSETLKPVCVAPCAVDLKPGMHVLRFAAE